MPKILGRPHSQTISAIDIKAILAEKKYTLEKGRPTENFTLLDKIRNQLQVIIVCQLRTGLRPGSSRFELSRHVEVVQTCSKLVADRFEAKFHYAILVAIRSEAGRRPSADLLARASSLLTSQMIGQIPARCRSATSFGSVCDQIA